VKRLLETPERAPAGQAADLCTTASQPLRTTSGPIQVDLTPSTAYSNPYPCYLDVFLLSRLPHDVRNQTLSQRHTDAIQFVVINTL
jgi:hypothetical protein